MIPSGLRLLFAGLALAGCAQFPELDALVEEDVKDQDFPTLLPYEESRSTGADPEETAQLLAELEARAEVLRQRADEMRNYAPGGAR